MPNSRQCKYPECLGFFTPKRKDQVYCHDVCRKAHYNDIYYHVVEVFKVCPNCGADFATTKPLIQVFCLPSCREDARTKCILRVPLEHLDQAVQSMEEYFNEHPTPEVSKAKVLAKYYSHSPDYVPAELSQQTDGGCELCGNNSRRLSSRNRLSLCAECLSFAVYVDRGMVDKYRELSGANSK